MKSDITRSTFKREKHYSGVRLQQGRVQLDADWNEQVDITNQRIATGTTDLIGHCGAPKDDAGFELIDAPRIDQLSGLSKAEKDELKVLLARGQPPLLIGQGRYYVDGILCENENYLLWGEQPDLPGLAFPTKPGFYLAYLDVWQRQITSVEDPSLREAALGGADTATRTKTVWQVKSLGPFELLQLDKICDPSFTDWKKLTERGPVRLAARVVSPATNAADLCSAASTLGFRRAQNQLYRVEVHRPSKELRPDPDATFKWSRDNGSILRAIDAIDLQTGQLTLSAPSRDELLKFEAGQWVEIIDDAHELGEGNGALVRLVNVSSDRFLTYDPMTATAAIPTGPGRKVRRWDQREAAEIIATPTQINDSETALPSIEGGVWHSLEDGIEVQFVSVDSYHTGDYWLIPARTANDGIDWPRDENGNSYFQDRHGIHHHYCRLAVLQLSSTGWEVKKDCREIFTPLAEQLNFFYLGGDGQEALPGQPLPYPLKVGVTRADQPIGGLRVRFEITDGNGSIGEGGGGRVFETETRVRRTEDGKDCGAGVASCRWILDAITPSQQVRATLWLDDQQCAHLPISFNANLSFADNVSYRPPECANELYPPETETVADALNEICNIQARHIGYQIPACGNGEATVQSLFHAAMLPQWLPGGPATVEFILNNLLCELKADRIPFTPACTAGLAEGEIPRTVAEALNAGNRKIAAAHRDRRQFVPLLAQTLPCLPYRDGRNYFFEASSPAGLVFDGRTIWVASARTSTLTRIGLDTTDPGGGLPIAVGARTWRGAFDGTHVWFTSPEGNSVFAIDPATATVVTRLDRDFSEPREIVFDGRYLWIANRGSATVRIVDTEDPEVIVNKSLREGGASFTPTALVFDGVQVWIGAERDAARRLFQIRNVEEEAAPLNTNLIATPVAMAFDGAHVWVACQSDSGDQAVYKIEVNGRVLTQQPEEVFPDSHDLVFDGRNMWLLAQRQSNSGVVEGILHKADVDTNANLGTLALPGVPQSAAFDGTHLWISSAGDLVRKILVG